VCNESGGPTLCEKCNRIGATIDRARRLASGIADELTIERLEAMVEDLQTEKTLRIFRKRATIKLAHYPRSDRSTRLRLVPTFFTAFFTAGFDRPLFFEA
jgi:hypothetical protein